ncbi:hypothetical protein OF83DRAFT_1175066 [Amylostereum chailletii]|nr:hypothetical protein OF83DRAFT_1175066 [Amylostereum chailletii]
MSTSRRHVRIAGDSQTVNVNTTSSHSHSTEASDSPRASSNSGVATIGDSPTLPHQHISAGHTPYVGTEPLPSTSNALALTLTASPTPSGSPRLHTPPSPSITTIPLPDVPTPAATQASSSTSSEDMEVDAELIAHARGWGPERPLPTLDARVQARSAVYPPRPWLILKVGPLAVIVTASSAHTNAGVTVGDVFDRLHAWFGEPKDSNDLRLVSIGVQRRARQRASERRPEVILKGDFFVGMVVRGLTWVKEQSGEEGLQVEMAQEAGR